MVYILKSNKSAAKPIPPFRDKEIKSRRSFTVYRGVLISRDWNRGALFYNSFLFPSTAYTHAKILNGSTYLCQLKLFYGHHVAKFKCPD